MTTRREERGARSDADPADLLLTGISQLATAPAAGPKRGPAMRDVRVVRDAAVAVRDGRVAWLGTAARRVEGSPHAGLTRQARPG